MFDRLERGGRRGDRLGDAGGAAERRRGDFRGGGARNQQNREAFEEARRPGASCRGVAGTDFRRTTASIRSSSSRGSTSCTGSLASGSFSTTTRAASAAHGRGRQACRAETAAGVPVHRVRGHDGEDQAGEGAGAAVPVRVARGDSGWREAAQAFANSGSQGAASARSGEHQKAHSPLVVNQMCVYLAPACAPYLAPSRRVRTFRRPVPLRAHPRSGDGR